MNQTTKFKIENVAPGNYAVVGGRPLRVLSVENNKNSVVVNDWGLKRSVNLDNVTKILIESELANMVLTRFA